jgi:hypothetical protein
MRLDDRCKSIRHQRMGGDMHPVLIYKSSWDYDTRAELDILIGNLAWDLIWDEVRRRVWLGVPRIRRMVSEEL